MWFLPLITGAMEASNSAEAAEAQFRFTMEENNKNAMLARSANEVMNQQWAREMGLAEEDREQKQREFRINMLYNMTTMAGAMRKNQVSVFSGGRNAG